MILQQTIKLCRCRLQQLPTQAVRNFARYAKYEKQAYPRLQVNIGFEGWKKYVVILYNLGFFKLLKWSLIGYVFWHYRNYTIPLIKYGLMVAGGLYFAMFWLRFAVYRIYGPTIYEKYTFDKVLRTRFERIFKDPIYEQYSTHKLGYLICKTYFQWLFVKPHRKWVNSIRTYLSSYKPMEHYLGKNFSHGVLVRPLYVEDRANGTFRGYFHWFVERETEFGQHYGMVEMQCDGNINSRVVNITEMKLHVMPTFGGEVLKFKPLRLSMDSNWKAINFEEGDYEMDEFDNENENEYQTMDVNNDDEFIYDENEFANDKNDKSTKYNNNRNKRNRDKNRKLYQRQTPTILTKRRPVSRKIEDADFTMKRAK